MALNAPYYTKTQVDSKVDPLKVDVEGLETTTNNLNQQVNNLELEVGGIADGTGGKSYPDLTTAMAVTPLPEDNTIFLIDPDNEDESGKYRYDSNEPNGWKFLEELGAKGKVEEGNTQAVSGGQVFDSYKQAVEAGVPLISFDLRAGVILASGGFNSSLNWLSTDKIQCNDIDRIYIEGMGISHQTLADRRIACYNDNVFLGFITQTTPSQSIDFVPLSGSNYFAVNIESEVDISADLSNSIFLKNLIITKVYAYKAPKIHAEYITGDINTKQIGDMLLFDENLKQQQKEFLTNFSMTFSNNAWNKNGGIVVDANYKRTSLTSDSSLAMVNGFLIVRYSGEIRSNASDIAGVLFLNQAKQVIGHACTDFKVYTNEVLVLPTGTFYIACCGYGSNPTLVGVKTLIEANSPNSVKVIDLSSISDTEDGTEANPYKTISKAIAENKNYSTTFLIKQGDYRETLDFAALENGDFRFIAKLGNRVRILGSRKLEGLTLTAGKTNTYECSYPYTVVGGATFGKLIFEDGNNSRPIATNERHPLQKSTQYRLPFSVLTEKTSIDEVESNPGTFYKDNDTNKLYIHTTNSTNPNTNGFSYEVMARAFNTIKNAKTNQSVNISLSNLQFFFGQIGLRFVGFNQVNRLNVSVLGCADVGCIRDDSANVYAVNDEVGFCNGDGINGHFTAWDGYGSLTDFRSMQPNCVYIDPWCHDNFDDGMSHHENHRVLTFGGLWEHNDDGGVRASDDANYTMYDPYSRYNGLVTGAGEGISAVNPVDNPNRNGCKVTIYGGFIEGNAYGIGVITDSRNAVEAIGTIIRNSTMGDVLAKFGRVICRNVRVTNSDPSKKKVVANGGTIEVINDELLT